MKKSTQDNADKNNQEPQGPDTKETSMKEKPEIKKVPSDDEPEKVDQPPTNADGSVEGSPQTQAKSNDGEVTAPVDPAKKFNVKYGSGDLEGRSMGSVGPK